MSYTVRRKNGRQLVVLADREVNGDYPVTLTGRMVNSYGEIQQDNMIWLTENFAGNDKPTKPLEGQLWYDTSAGALKVCTDEENNTFTKLLQINSRAPSRPDNGDLWYDSSSKKLYIWDAEAGVWNIVGPTFDNTQKIVNPASVVTTSTSSSKTITIGTGTQPGDLDIDPNSVFTFTITIIARSSMMPTVYNGMWIFKGLAYSDDNNNLHTVGKVDVESRLSDDAMTFGEHGWEVNYMETSGSTSTGLTFQVLGMTGQSSDNVVWKTNMEVIINAGD